MDTGLGWKVGQMDTGLELEGRTDGYKTRMEGGTD